MRDVLTVTHLAEIDWKRRLTAHRPAEDINDIWGFGHH